MIKAVLFDMNGVIIGDEHIHEQAFRETVKPYGIDLDHQAYLQCCAGKTDEAGYEEIVEKFSVAIPIDELLEQKNQIYMELFAANKKNYPGVLELIDELAQDFTLAITSSASRKNVDLITDVFGIRDKFKLTISANEVSKGKPDPEPYLVTAQKLGFKAEECVVIEDSRSGVESAKQACCYCIAITTTHRRADLKKADLVVDEFREINSEVIKGLER